MTKNNLSHLDNLIKKYEKSKKKEGLKLYMFYIAKKGIIRIYEKNKKKAKKKLINYLTNGNKTNEN
jgi:hypothetical protein